MNKIDDFQIILTSVNQLIVRSKSLRKTIAQEDRENVESIIKNAERLKTTVTLYSNEAKEDPTEVSAVDAEIALKESEILLYISILNLRRDIKAKQEALDKAMLNEARNGRKAAWLAIGGGIFMGLFVAFFMGRALTRPIRQLVDGTEKIAQGNLDFRVEVKSNDEIGQLAHSFNNMAEDLCFSIKKEKEFAAQAIAATEAEKKKSDELQRIQKNLEKHAAELSRSNNELEEFAYIASHDLQEPLRKVKTFGDRLIQKYGEVLGDQGRDYLKRMGNATNRMQTLINDLLAYSRVTSKAKPFVPVNLNDIVRDVLSDLEI
ncbi:MAG: HAMP domain-containing protein, partial [Candidatus Omnitrophica bacterium]|nr:HAMP domain-containing protein [Candidatus Omnitrophota bacterium]